MLNLSKFKLKSTGFYNYMSQLALSYLEDQLDLFLHCIKPDFSLTQEELNIDEHYSLIYKKSNYLAYLLVEKGKEEIFKNKYFIISFYKIE